MNIKVNSSNLILISIIALSAAFSTYQIYMELQDVSVGKNLVNAWGFCFAVLIAIWTVQNSKNIGIPRLSSFGFLMLVLWPLVLLYYLISSKGIEGLVFYIGFWALYTAPFFLGLVAYTYG